MSAIAKALTLSAMSWIALPALASVSDTVAPAEVSNMMMVQEGDSVVLTWAPVDVDSAGLPEESVSYRIYRGTSPSFIPETNLGFTMLAETDSTSYRDSGAAAAMTSYYYLVSAVDNSGNESITRSSEAAGYPTGQFPAFERHYYFRYSGEPATLTDSFSIPNPNTTYTLVIQNGGMLDSQFERVSSSVILLNGIQVVGPEQFNQNVALITAPVTLQHSNELSVELRGKPGGAIALEIIGIDNEPPLISATIAPPPNMNGWNKTDVTVTFECTDAISQIMTCPDPVLVQSEAAAQIIQGQAVDAAGNTATTTVNLNIDKTPPQMAIVSPVYGTTLNTSTPLFHVSFSDNLSGIQSGAFVAVLDSNDITAHFAVDTASALYQPLTSESLADGNHAFTATIADAAGNIMQDAAPFSIDLGPTVAIEAGLSVLNIPVGESGNIAYVVAFEGTTPVPQHIQFTQEVTPNVGGLALTTDVPPGWTTNSTQSWIVNETIVGNTEGAYQVKTIVEIVESGVRNEVITMVNVTGNAPEPVLGPLGSVPDGLRLSTVTDVVYTTTLLGSTFAPTSIAVEEIDSAGHTVLELGPLFDDGAGADLVAGDRVYSGQFSVLSGAEGTRRFRAVAGFPGLASEVVSDFLDVPVTRFEVELRPFELSRAVLDPGTGEEIISNMVIVSFQRGIDPDTIEAIATSVSGTVVGSILGLGYYQVEIPDAGDYTGVANAIAILNSRAEVATAEAAKLGSIAAVTPSDSSFSAQWGLTKIRADEAWVTARGNPLIAVLDTGIDDGHPDLLGKLVKGRNYMAAWYEPWNWYDPDDDNGHGTHVSGIAAAETDNSQGVAGVAWNSKVLAVKVCDAAGNCPIDTAAKGIKYAADKGARVINMSLRWDSGSSSLKDAVDYASAKGALVVAAAGNDGDTAVNYPAAYTNVLSVGNTTSSDGRNSTSNYGSWVNIAAPGTGIISTMPTYNVTLNNAPYNYAQNYDSLSGTSMASPMVAGAAAVLWSKHPSWTAAQVRERLEKTAVPLSGLQLGAGRIDLFEAVFNGSFEIDDMSEWTRAGTVNSLGNLGPLMPQDRKRMCYASTGPSGDQVAAAVFQTFAIEDGVTSLPIKFEYNFVTEEYPEWVGSIYDDSLRIVLVAPNGAETILAQESINNSNFSTITGIDFPGGDNTVGQTGWKTVNKTISVSSGSGTYRIEIRDAGDDIYDSVVLLDHIRFK